MAQKPRNIRSKDVERMSMKSHPLGPICLERTADHWRDLAQTARAMAESNNYLETRDYLDIAASYDGWAKRVDESEARRNLRRAG